MEKHSMYRGHHVMRATVRTAVPWIAVGPAGMFMCLTLRSLRATVRDRVMNAGSVTKDGD